MANNVKYAQNLIGDWSKNIYEPKKQVLQDIYQTNWNKLSNDYNTLKDTLARNYETARQAYNNELSNIQNESFNRMNASTIDLANRGLTSSGVGNLVQNADTQIKGEDVNKSLSSLLDTNNKNVSGLIEGTNSLGAQQTSLADQLAGDVAGLTDADAANNQQYAGLVSGIAESAASRAASRALASASRREEDDEDELKRRMLISDILDAEDMSDDDKVKNLVLYGGVEGTQARNAVSAINYNKTQANLVKAQEDLNNYIAKKGLDSRFYTPQAINIINNATDEQIRRLASEGYIGNKGWSKSKPTTAPASYEDYLIADYINSQRKNPISLVTGKAQGKANKVGGLYKDLANYTYGDLYDILYGRG
jgi:hypothetical protein